ncbi:MAG: UDP-2,3-diacylglucosamine diphosphatase [Saprospiraceae bacterium]|nr:UDP-2,3-diacylglucosamine diphosphatase [Saprospiraceae bacterium]
MSKIYFASDFHLGAPNYEASREREAKIVRWLSSIQHDASEIYLMGDIFDFWFEYATVVPKGFTRFLGKLAELSDAGIKIHVFTGNHDLWMSGYFEKELGIPVNKEPEERMLLGKTFYLGHGDGLGPGDRFYKFLRRVFHHPLFQGLFHFAHPDIGMRIAHAWSRKSRADGHEEQFLGEDNEWLAIYAKECLEKKHYDFFIFGHRHLPLDIQLNENGSRYINLGEWINHFTFAVFDGENLQLKTFEG